MTSGGSARGAAAAHDAARRETPAPLCENFRQARKAGPGSDVAGRQERVGGDDAREALGMLGDQPQADEAAPVLADERDVAQVERRRARRRIQSTWRW